MRTKQKFFHILNQRSRRKQREEQEREREKLEDQIRDPRRKSTLYWIEPLIEDDE
jgi:hypothetical protein